MRDEVRGRSTPYSRRDSRVARRDSSVCATRSRRVFADSGARVSSTPVTDACQSMGGASASARSDASRPSDATPRSCAARSISRPIGPGAVPPLDRERHGRGDRLVHLMEGFLEMAFADRLQGLAEPPIERGQLVAVLRPTRRAHGPGPGGSRRNRSRPCGSAGQDRRGPRPTSPNRSRARRRPRKRARSGTPPGPAARTARYGPPSR